VADHYTLRLAPGMRQRLIEWARRAGLAERTLAQRYVEEGLRHDAHPLIQFLDGPSGRRASLVGRGLDVWESVATVRDNDGSIARAAEYLQVPAGLVEAAVAYYGEYRDEIDREIELNEAEYERGRASAAAGERDDLAGRSDRSILEAASSEQRAVVTNNIKGFRPLASEWLAQGRIHGGLIFLPSSRTRTRSAVPALVAAIEGVLREHPDGLNGCERWIGPLSSP